MEALLNMREEKRKKSMILAFVVHIILIILLFLPLLTYQEPPPGQEGILVAFGQPDEGSAEQAALPAESPAASEEEEPAESAEPAQAEPVPEPEKEILQSDRPDPALEAARRKASEEAERRRAEEEARKKAEEEARKKREEQARKLEEQKSQFGDLLSRGSGSNSKPGQQGDPEGDPDSDVLAGLSKGSGRVGGGLSNRGLLHEPTVTDNSQKTGRVVVRVCVDGSGKVISADYTQKGSTTTDGELKRKAIEGARQYRFSSSDIDEQCGTITFDFRLQ